MRKIPASYPKNNFTAEALRRRGICNANSDTFFQLLSIPWRPRLGGVYNRNREDLRGQAEFIVARQRNGPVGAVNMVFLHAQTKFENRAEDTGELPEK